ncbi:ion channel nompc, putative [Talaromyces stipitatus ATCC 10500]|uniref:Ion channel nompc, putative n=1 Tax=Talaromyces stipitatus (strain ATCC 10500 / CBS 375.48 / QM 6759 / NRRL 1006) TaxID=441959 RepID=B8MPI5_TALSN|nr:ion channel nompc, putative [Talaromyces stipitatus ATCC 10500]EED14424.1 ion channel nompc, putative [Talaromyces stipitatus ATCC 10500]
MHGPVIECFLESSSVPKNHEQQVSYFYCAKTHGLGSKPIELFQSMVRQLAWLPKDSQIEQYINDEWKRRQASKTDRLSLNDCKMLLLRLIPRVRKTILIIDALDECDSPRDVFISSRDEVHFDVHTTFSDYLALNITSTATGPDLRRYIERRVDDEFKHFRQVTEWEDPSILQRLVDELTDRGQLAFRWTELQLALFFPSGRPPNPIDIKRRLERLKNRTGLLDLNNTYKEIYEHNISDSFTRKDDLHFLLKWSLACIQNAHIRLLTDALKFHYEQQGETTGHINYNYILNLASNLLVIDEHDTVQFAHISVKEYFQLTTDFASEFTKGETNNQVAETCLQYLLSSYQNFPYYDVYGQMEAEFFHYSLTRWALHYSRSGKTCSSTVLFKKLIPGASAGSEFAAWVLAGIDWHGFYIGDIKDALSRPLALFFYHNPEQLKALNLNGWNGLHLAAYYNQLHVVEALIRTDIDINLRIDDKERRTALQQAVIRGNTEVVRFLLLEREDVNVNIRDRSGHSAIHHAINHGHVEMVRFLLDSSKDLNINLQLVIDWVSDFPGLTPLHLAITKGYFDIVTMLLEKRDDIQINADSSEGSPLHVAARRGYVDIIEILFRERNDIDIHQKDDDGCTALHIASAEGFASVVMALLGKDNAFQVNSVDDYGRTALHCAAQHGHAKVVQVLLNERDDLDVDLQDRDGCTALHLAAKYGHVAVIENLLHERENIQVNTREVAGRTALHLASEAGNAEAISALLMNGVSLEINVQDTDDCTALHLACQNHRSEAVKALLEGCEDLKVNIRNKDGQTALHLAVKKLCEDIVDELATNPNVDPNIANDNGQTALHIAASTSNAAVLESLLRFSSRIDINARNDKQQTALHLTLSFSTYLDSTYVKGYYAAKWRHDSTEFVRVLLQNGIDTTSQDGAGKTALYIAAEEGHSEAFAMILEKCKGANLNEQDELGWTMLHWVASNDAKPILERLIQQWPDCVNVADKYGRTAPHIACSEGRLVSVQALLDGKSTIDINRVDNLKGYTALHYAVSTKSTQIVRVLLDTRPDIDINLAIPNGQTAIQMAITEKDVKTLQVLLDKREDIDINHVDNEGKTALLIGALSYQSRSIFALLENRCDLSINAKLEDGRTALHIMLEKGLFYKRFDETCQIVKMLLESYKDVVEINARDVHGRTVSHVAAQFGRFDALKTMVEICHDVNLEMADKDGRSIFHYAASRGYMDDIVLRLDNREEAEGDDEDEDFDEDENEENSGEEEDSTASEGSDSDSDEQDDPKYDGRGDLVTEQTVQIMSLLLERCNNAIVNAKDNRGLTAFHIASLACDGGIVEKLLSDDREIDVNAQDNYGWTALHVAVFYRRPKVVETLLTKCTWDNINIQDNKGQTALHLAASKGRVKLVKALLDNRKDIKLGLKDEKERTALDLAEEGNHVEVVNMLKAANGQNHSGSMDLAEV